MEAALVTVATGAMKPLLSKLSKLLEEEHAKIKGVRRDAKFLQCEMSTMSATLQMLADEEEINPQMKIWRDDVRELSYDMEDCVDDFTARIDHEHDGSTRLQKFLGKFKMLKPRHEIACEIEELKARATDASKRHKRYHIVKPTLNSSTCAIDPRLQALYEEVDKLVGIDGPKKHIIKWFKREGHSKELKVVSIVGSGGLGKTTLANQVYHTIKSQFSCAAFVSVSRKPNLKKILRDISKEVGISRKKEVRITDSTSDDDVQQLIDRLREHLCDKRYFVVIDDVWDSEALKTIRHALLDNNHGSRIIATTRNTAVALCCSQSYDYVYRMKHLSFADSKMLLFKRAFGYEDLCYPHLEEVSNHILKKCGGLPLAIITISSLLADQYAEEKWKMVLAAIGSALAKDPVAGNMTKILSLSYFDLPRHLRTCLLYLSVFPEDHIIRKQNLIARWIAEGFVHEEQRRSTYEVGEGYFNDLINRSLIQAVDVNYGEAEACRVHDIIHDFITCKAAEENFVTLFDSAGHAHNSEYTVLRRLSVENSNNEGFMIPTSLILSHVRSLNIFGLFVQNSLFAFPALRVLDLGESSQLRNHHLANIEKLFFLKYLRLGSSSITELPRKIGELQYLETLDIQGTNIGLLPSTITRLQRLARLYLGSGSRFLDELIGQMQSLEELGVLNVRSSEQGKSLQEFSQLTKLRTLEVRFNGLLWTEEDIDLQSYVGTLIASCNLHHLYISYRSALPYARPLSLESCCPTTPCRLRKLHFQYCYIGKVPNWMSSLGNLRELNISMYGTKPEDVAILGAVPALVILKLQTLYGTNGRMFIRGFRNLKFFNLSIIRCGTSVEFVVGSMPKIEHLKLTFCARKMECVNVASDFGIQHLSTLTKVEVRIRGFSDTGIKIAGLIKTSVGELPNHPRLLLPLSKNHEECQHFEEYFNLRHHQIEEEQREQGLAGDTYWSFLGQIVREIKQGAYNTSHASECGC